MRAALAIAAVALFLLSGLLAADPVSAPPPSTKTPPTYVIRAPVIEQTPSGQVQATGGVTITQDDMELQAEEITGDPIGGGWAAEQNVILQRPDGTLHADKLTYNAESGTGVLTNGHGQYGLYYLSGSSMDLLPNRVIKINNGVGTTCDLKRPDWALGAKTITVYPGRYAVARDVGVYIGGHKIFVFPSYRYSLKKSGQSFLPTPGIDRTDGGYLKFQYPLTASWATSVQARGRLTERRGVEAAVDMERSVPFKGSNEAPDAFVEGVPQDFTNASLLPGPRVDNRPRLDGGSYLQESQTPPERNLHMFVGLGHNDRILDPIAGYLYLDREPEVGLREVGIPIGIPSGNKKIGYLTSQVSYGRFREQGGHFASDSRLDARAAVQLQARVAGRLTLAPGILGRVSRYGDGEHQNILAGSLALGEVVSRQYFLAVTYVNQSVTGGSPFQFDNVDLREKLGTRVEANWGATRAYVTVDFDLQRGGVYDWSLNLARAFHCFEPQIYYSHRYGDLRASIAFIAARR